MRCSDREYFTRRQAEEEQLAQCASVHGAPIHRLLAEEYARRITLIDRIANPSSLGNTVRTRKAVSQAQQV